MGNKRYACYLRFPRGTRARHRLLLRSRAGNSSGLASSGNTTTGRHPTRAGADGSMAGVTPTCQSHGRTRATSIIRQSTEYSFLHKPVKHAYKRGHHQPHHSSKGKHPLLAHTSKNRQATYHTAGRVLCRGGGGKRYYSRMCSERVTNNKRRCGSLGTSPTRVLLLTINTARITRMSPALPGGGVCLWFRIVAVKGDASALAP